MNYVYKDVYMGSVYSDNANFDWKELEITYDKVDGSVIFNLLQKINDVKQGGSSVAYYYYHGLNSLWREFYALTKLPKSVWEVTCSYAASSELVLHQQLMKLMIFVSLLFVNKTIRDSKMYVGFNEDTCYIHDLKKEIVLGTGSESRGIYLFDKNKDNSIGKSNMVMCFNVFKLLWHNKLVHPTYQVLSVLHNDLKISKTSSVHVYEICHRAQQTRDPFPLSSHKSKTLGAKVNKIVTDQIKQILHISNIGMIQAND
ncbi:hypothetical protein Tco_1259153 [Tanacetum coccineum]